ncbi:MAG: UDP-N-acetylmuramate dehydrogenase [Deltaproteobacteria bacterium]|nr:UDP-N-acetylmuramate dehydrogenase [Deltaproteobacteria bacterium]
MALDSNIRSWLTDIFGANVKFDEAMSRHTTLRIGGPADAYVTPEEPEDLILLIKKCREGNIPYMVIGGGSNLLVLDSGIRGIVIGLTKCLNKICQADIGKEKVSVKAMSGARMSTLCTYAIKHGLAGMNFALGIPGSVGGGIIMNAGTAEGSMEDVLASIEVLLPTGETRVYQKNSLGFSYRKLSFEKVGKEFESQRLLIMNGSFTLSLSEPNLLKGEAKAILKGRREKQPFNCANAGCFFKNPAEGKGAGRLIELAGLKGIRKGDLEVSNKHANFIINRGKATASDILELTDMIRDTVFKKFNVKLETEVKVVG